MEGWDGDPVPTSPSYATFREHYRDLARLVENAGLRIVNCTEGGARLPGVEHRRFGEMLDECCTEPVDLSSRLRALYDAREVPQASRTS